MTTTATGCTDAQRAEWSAMHDRMADISKRRESAQYDATHYLNAHVEAGAFTPGPFGVPSVEAVTAYTRACEAATEAGRLRGEWKALYEKSQAHPYTAELKARTEDVTR